jgi:hypothetical protein
MPRELTPEALDGAIASTKRLLRDHYGVEGIIEISVVEEEPGPVASARDEGDRS